jgi:hypothetical protein
MDDTTQPIALPPPAPHQPGDPAPASLASRLLRMGAGRGLRPGPAGRRRPGRGPGHPGAGGSGRAARSAPARLGVAGAAVALALVAGGAGVWAAGAGGHADHDQAAAGHLHGDATAAGTAGGAGAAGAPKHVHGPNLAPVAAASDDERARAEALWKASAANAERWRDQAAAARAGFRFRDQDEAGPGRPVRFLHVPNPAWRADGRVLDPAHPETLVYWTGPGERLTLVGVMYTAPRGAHGNTVGGPITRWHDHESCRDPATQAKLAGRSTAPAPRARSTAAASR